MGCVLLIFLVFLCSVFGLFVFVLCLLYPLLQVHRYKSSTVVISTVLGWPLRNIHISNDNRSFTFYVDVFLPLSLTRLWSDLTVLNEYLGIRKVQERGTAYFSRAPVSTPGFCGVRVVLCFSFCVVPLCVFTFRVQCFYVRCEFHITLCSVRLYIQEGSCLICAICVCLHIVVPNTYCVVFLFCLSSFSVPYLASFPWLFIFDCPCGIL